MFSVLFIQYSWAKFISQRCSNVNRNSDSDVPKPKRKQMETNLTKHQYLQDSQSIVVNDTVAFTRNMKKLAAEMSKTKPSPANLEDIMKQTFPNRRTSILNGELSLLEV